MLFPFYCRHEVASSNTMFHSVSQDFNQRDDVYVYYDLCCFFHGSYVVNIHTGYTMVIMYVKTRSFLQTKNMTWFNL